MALVIVINLPFISTTVIKRLYTFLEKLSLDISQLCRTYKTAPPFFFFLREIKTSCLYLVESSEILG